MAKERGTFFLSRAMDSSRDGNHEEKEFYTSNGTSPSVIVRERRATRKGWSFEMEETIICTREKYNRRVAGR